MTLVPQKELSESDVKKGLKMVILDGLATEVMIAFTSSTFLVAMAILLGANNKQIGLLAALPAFTNLAQLISIVLVRKFNNRRAIAVYCSYLGRFPLILIGAIILWMQSASMELLITFLFLHYFFGSVAGPSWNSWMKDLVPENILGSYFSRRTRYTQILNVILSISLAILLDFIRKSYPGQELLVYASFFIFAGIIGILGGYLLSKAPERRSHISNVSIVCLFKLPLQNLNFRRLLFFNSAWVFAINLGIPFFTAFMMKKLGLPISYIILLVVLGQISSILTIRLWGAFSDKYSNKTIIGLSAPIYIFCILAWCFVGVFPKLYLNLILLGFIHIFSGIATAGINLTLTNIGLKLAPAKDAIVYLSVKNVITAIFASIAPVIGGILADYFANIRFTISIQLNSPELNEMVSLLTLQEFKFLFLITGILAIFTLELLIHVNEVGEKDKTLVKKIMKTTVRKSLKELFFIGDIISLNNSLIALFRPKSLKKKV